MICNSCEDCLREIALYRWSEETSGRDAPHKDNDHAMDDMRYFAMDLAAERERIAKEKEKAENGLRIVEQKLSNEKFVSRAPEAVVNAEKEKAAKFRELIAKLEESEKALGC